MEINECTLGGHAFFREIDPGYLKRIARIASTARYEAGEFLFRESEAADRFFLLCEGKVAIEIHAPGRGQILIETLSAGDILGWSWSVPPYRKRFDARALEATTAVVVDGPQLRRMCEEHKDLGYELFKRLIQVVAQRLQATRLQLIDVFSAH